MWKNKTYIKAGYCVVQYDVLQGLKILKMNFETKLGHILMVRGSSSFEKSLGKASRFT